MRAVSPIGISRASFGLPLLITSTSAFIPTCLTLYQDAQCYRSMPPLSLAGITEVHGHRITENIHRHHRRSDIKHRLSYSHYGWMDYRQFICGVILPLISTSRTGCFDHLSNCARECWKFLSITRLPVCMLGLNVLYVYIL